MFDLVLHFCLHIRKTDYTNRLILDYDQTIFIRLLDGIFLKSHYSIEAKSVLQGGDSKW